MHVAQDVENVTLVRADPNRDLARFLTQGEPPLDLCPVLGGNRGQLCLQLVHGAIVAGLDSLQPGWLSTKTRQARLWPVSDPSRRRLRTWLGGATIDRGPSSLTAGPPTINS